MVWQIKAIFHIKIQFMQWLIFSNRVVVICNICYVLAVIARRINISTLPNGIISTIVVLGFISVFLNVLLNLINLLAVLLKMKIPIGLFITNLLFLVFQLINILYLEL
jgi:hypothetical protein